MRLVVFYPSRGIGGAQLLFSRISESLAKEKFEIVVVDFGDGFISKYLTDKSVEFTHAHLDQGEKFDCGPEDFLLLSLSMIFGFEHRLNLQPTTRIAFWDLHPYNLLENTAFSFFYKRSPTGIVSRSLKFIEYGAVSKIGLIIDFLTERSALYFMCQKNYVFNKSFFGCRIDPNFLPIPIPGVGSRGKKGNSEVVESVLVKPRQVIEPDTILNIGWISRLDVDKVPILNLLLSDADAFAVEKKKKVVVHVVGEGTASHTILRMIHAELRMVGRLEQDALSNYVKNSIDIGFSMGTSVLEFAARGKPAVMVPGPTLYGYFRNEASRYVWLHNAKAFDVAVEEYYDSTLRNSFAGIIKSYQSDAKFLAATCEEYVTRTHDLESVSRTLRKNIENATFTYRDFKKNGIFSRGWLASALNSIKALVKYMLTLRKKVGT